MEAVLCPVCNGKGRTWFYDSTHAAGEECHACKGDGYLWSHEGIYGDYEEPIHENKGVLLGASPIDRCPACGGLKSSPAGSGCPMGSHYGTYCLV